MMTYKHSVPHLSLSREKTKAQTVELRSTNKGATVQPDLPVPRSSADHRVLNPKSEFNYRD
jgi:hypothetical protein